MAACSTAAQPTLPPATIPAVVTATTETAPTPVPTPLSTGAALLQRLPKCDGIQILEEPVKFNWPNIDERLKELEGALWGYYSCEEPPEQAAAFYREQMPKPPTNMYETNWVVRTEGTVGVYYNGSSLTWVYLWVIPLPDDPQKSYVIVAETTDPVVGGCRLDRPTFNNEIGGGEIPWSVE